MARGFGMLTAEAMFRGLVSSKDCPTDLSNAGVKIVKGTFGSACAMADWPAYVRGYFIWSLRRKVGGIHRCARSAKTPMGRCGLAWRDQRFFAGSMVRLPV